MDREGREKIQSVLAGIKAVQAKAHTLTDDDLLEATKFFQGIDYDIWDFC